MGAPVRSHWYLNVGLGCDQAPGATVKPDPDLGVPLIVGWVVACSAPPAVAPMTLLTVAASSKPTRRAVTFNEMPMAKSCAVSV